MKLNDELIKFLQIDNSSEMELDKYERFLNLLDAKRFEVNKLMDDIINSDSHKQKMAQLIIDRLEQAGIKRGTSKVGDGRYSTILRPK